MADYTNGLAAFLAARLDEDQATAREFHEVQTCGSVCTGWDYNFDPDRCDCGYPARVLREVEAKRAILAECQAVWKLQDLTNGGRDRYRNWIISHLAAAYSDHPDYQQAWKP